ncbi:unnamed protein product, partial [Prunus armeniaca]
VTRKLEGHSKRVTSLAFSNTLNIFVFLCGAGWEKQRSKLLQIPDGKELRSLSGTYIQIHQNELQLLVINKTHLAWVPDFSASISHATYSGDGQTVYGTICILDASVLELHCQINPSAYLDPVSVIFGGMHIGNYNYFQTWLHRSI